jgi:uncharacterized hydrophobic protein (TIGR00271 family)
MMRPALVLEARVLYLRAFATPDQATRVIDLLASIPDVHHVVRQATADGREEMITADLDASAVDPALEALLDAGLAATDVMVERTNPIGPAEQHSGRWLEHRGDAMVWAEVVEGARENARLPARYLVLMFVAGVLAGFAVLLQNSVLIVGAMAVSPDLLPVTAICVGIVGRRIRLVGRSVGTLVLGMSVAIVTACLLTLVLDGTGYLEAKPPTGSVLVLTPKEDLLLPTIVIAFVAGIAGMIATETRASAAVGVAISVTTIPSAAYAGVALAVGTVNETLFGLGFLGINIASLVLGGTFALVVQRRSRRAGPSPARPASPSDARSRE